MITTATKLRLTVIVVLVLTSCSCRSFEAKQKTEATVERAVDKFHEKLNQEQYQSIYVESDGNLRMSVSEEEFIEQLRQAHEQLGITSGKAIVIIDDRGWKGIQNAFTKREIVRHWHMPANDSIIASENFVWAVENHQPKLVSYQFRTVCKKPCSIGFGLPK